MNEFGFTLLWLMLQISALCVVAIPVYLLARRSHPRTGALATLATLLLITLVTVSTFSPWPHWSLLATFAEPASGVTIAGSSAAADGDTSPTGDHNPQTVDRVGAIESGAAGRSSSMALIAAAAGDLWRALGHAAQPAVVDTLTTQSGSRLAWSGWIAWLFVVGLVVALGRFALGLLAVRNHRLISTAITDPEILSEVAVLCAESGCRSPVEIRRSESITSAATVGWRRPLILLPPEFVDWSASERRSVLAHEIAHICGHDFLCWVCAQAGLLLHFYHPLVHWLAGRLRLEQELAADAVAARCSGGPETYLHTLAALALRQADRPVAWPARTFLPVKGTLMRRVEMLRETRVARAVPSLWRHSVVIALLVAASFVLSGIRPPERTQAGAAEPAVEAAPLAPPATVSSDQPATESEAAVPAADQFAQADDKKARREKRKARKAAASDTATADGAFDLKYVPTSTNLLIGIRPSSLASDESLAPFINDLEQNILKSEGGPELKIADLKQVLLLGIPDGGPNPVGSDPLFVLTLQGDAFERVPQWAEALTGKSGESRQYAGYEYLPGRSSWAVAVLHGEVVVIGREKMLKVLLDAVSGGQTAPSWSEPFKAVAQGQMCLALRVSALRDEIERGVNRPGQQPGPAVAFAPLWQQTQVLVGSASLGETAQIELIAHCLDDSGAQRVAETAQALVPLGRNILAGIQRQFGGAPGPGPAGPTAAEKFQEMFNKSFSLAGQFLDSVKIVESGNTVQITADLGTGNLPVVVGLLLPALQNARGAARHAQSQNNLKQIALAMHNYHEVYGHFPAPAVLGPDGKTTHSWRVAILPFVEQAALYQQYRLDEPWDSENNLRILQTMPPVFRHPSESDTGKTDSSYFALTGENTGLGDAGKGVRIAEITDGTSNTLLVVEAQRQIPWTKPDDIAYSADKPLPKFGGFSPDVWLAAFADGSVMTFAEAIDEKTVRAMITRNGGEVVERP